MVRKSSGNNKSVVKYIAAFLFIAVLAYSGYHYTQICAGARHANEVMEEMRAVIPGLGVDTDVSSGNGRDPLPEVVISDKGIVGCIQVPAIEVTAPVTSTGQEEEGFATLSGGSPVKGNLKISGGRKDVFRNLSKVRPGDTVAFTDIDGVRYNYRVLTQFHLKDWDEADQELLLCFRTDDDTMFVVGCTEAN